MRTSALFVATLLVTCTLFAALPAAIASGARAAGTDVPPVLTGSNVWIGANSPYRIHTNVTLEMNAVLTIESGVDVLFDENTGLIINSSTLNIIGQLGSVVNFTSNLSTPYPGCYGFIHIRGDGALLAADYGNFLFGIKGFYIEGNGSWQNLQVRNCTFSNNQEAGIYGTGLVGLGVYDCEFWNSSGYGIHLENSNNCTISNSRFYNNSWVNIALSDSQYIPIQYCGFTNGTESVALYMARGVLLTQGNISGAGIGVRMTLSTDTTIDHMMFNTCNVGVILNDSVNSLLRSNNLDASGDGILFEGGPGFEGTSIDSTNMQGGGPILFVTGNQSLGGVAAGEVLVAGGHDLEIKDINMTKGGHVQLFRSSNCTVSNVTLDSPSHGFSVVSSQNCNVKACTVMNAKESGFSSLNSSSVEFSAGTISGCKVGMDIMDSQNANANVTSFFSNLQDIVVSNSALLLLNSPINISDVQPDSTVKESFTLIVAVQNEQAAPLQGADVSVLQPEILYTAYSTPHFGGNDSKTNSEGRIGPVIVASYLTQNGIRRSAPTLIDVWSGTMVFGGTRNITVSKPLMETFTAQAVGTLSGTVRNQTGVAVVGATVKIESGPTNYTNSTGGYAFQNLSAGLYNLTVVAAGYIASVATGVSVVAGNTTIKDFTLTPQSAALGSVAGTVRDGNGTPLQGVNVSIPTLGIGSPLTDASGNFSISNVTPGTHSVQASKAGYNTWTGNVVVVSGEVARLNINLTVFTPGNQTGSVSGRVTNANGTALNGSTVYAIGQSMTATTGADGYYWLLNMTVGTYTLRATYPGLSEGFQYNVRVTAGNTTVVNFVLDERNIFRNDSLGVQCEASFRDNGTLEIMDSGAKDRPLGGNIGVFFRIERSVGSKLDWINITVKYDRAKLPSGVNESGLRLYWYDKDLKMWKVCDQTGVDTARGIVWANMSHLTLFGVGGGSGPKGEGATIALAGGITPLAFIAVVLLVGVPIGILVIRIRTPPPARKPPQMQESRYQPPDEPF